jgi:hypothetical protein
VIDTTVELRRSGGRDHSKGVGAGAVALGLGARWDAPEPVAVNRTSVRAVHPGRALRGQAAPR